MSHKYNADNLCFKGKDIQFQWINKYIFNSGTTVKFNLQTIVCSLSLQKEGYATRINGFIINNELFFMGMLMMNVYCAGKCAS